MEPVMEGQTPGGIIVWVRPEEHRAASEIEFKALIKMLQRENSVLRVFPLKREIEHNSFSQMEIMQGAKNLGRGPPCTPNLSARPSHVSRPLKVTEGASDLARGTRFPSAHALHQHLPSSLVTGPGLAPF